MLNIYCIYYTLPCCVFSWFLSILVRYFTNYLQWWYNLQTHCFLYFTLIRKYGTNARGHLMKCLCKCDRHTYCSCLIHFQWFPNVTAVEWDIRKSHLLFSLLTQVFDQVTCFTCTYQVQNLYEKKYTCDKCGWNTLYCHLIKMKGKFFLEMCCCH